jgi:glycosyltransferase involved in cell wall biosynthesis
VISYQLSAISSENQLADRPPVTVLIDTYNYGHFLGRAIESVMGQTYPSTSIEILVVDDGSTDKTAEVVEQYGDRVRYIRKARGGQASAINEGFRQARGDIICLLDADDYFYPDKVRRVVAEFQSGPAVGLVHDRFDIIDEMSQGTREVSWERTWTGCKVTVSKVPSQLQSLILLGHPWNSVTSAMSVRKTVVQGTQQGYRRRIPSPPNPPLPLRGEGGSEGTIPAGSPLSTSSVGRSLRGRLWAGGEGIRTTHKGMPLQVPEDVFVHSPDLFLSIILPFVAEVRVIESPLTAYVFHGRNVGLYRPSPLNREIYRRQVAYVRRYVEERFGKRFVTYFGRSVYGPEPDAEWRHKSRFGVYMADCMEISRANVEWSIKLESQLRLAASLLLPPKLYDGVRQVRAVQRRVHLWRG